mgnify:CR=1 FL=1
MEKYVEEIKETLKMPDKLITKPYNKGYYYKNYKYLKEPNKFVMAVVKYLNGKGFIITTYLEEKIKWIQKITPTKFIMTKKEIF